MELNSILSFVFYGTAAVFIPLSVTVILYSMIDNARRKEPEEETICASLPESVILNEKRPDPGVILINNENGKIVSDYSSEISGAHQTDFYEDLYCTFTFTDGTADEFPDVPSEYDDYEEMHDGLTIPDRHPSVSVITGRKPSQRNRVNRYLFRDNFTLNYRG